MNRTLPSRPTRTSVITRHIPGARSPWLARRARAVAIVGLLLSGSLPATAHAGAEGSGSSTDDAIEAEVRFDDNARDQTGCFWAMVTGVDPSTGVTRHMPASRMLGGEPWTLFERVCGTTRTLHWVKTSSAGGVANTSRDRVSRLVPRLLVKTSPTADKMVVNVGTWFWVPRSLWRPVSVTAMLPTTAGPIIVTTTAVPTLLIFSPGDGRAPVVCRGPGRPWRTSFGDGRTSSCMHTYTRASHTSGSRRYRARLSVQWTVTWTSNLGVGGRLPSIRLGISTDVRVSELQALSR